MAKIRNPIRLKSRNKFSAVKTVVDGIRFDSKAEAKRYDELRVLEKLGYISNLIAEKSKMRHELNVNGIHICTYVADFEYFYGGTFVVEDCKGFKTPEYKLKKKLFRAIYGFDITEVK